MEKGPDGTYPYKSPIDCAMKTFSQEGPLKFYTGFPTYCFRWVVVDDRSVGLCFMQGAQDLCCPSLHAKLILGQLLDLYCAMQYQANGSTHCSLLSPPLGRHYYQISRQPAVQWL